MTDVPIAQALAVLADRDPERVAVRCGDDVLTRAELVRRGRAVAAAWRADGVADDDAVAICLPNGVDLVVACVAAWTAGAVPFVLARDLPAGERDALLAEAAPALVVDGALAEGSAEVEDRPPASSWKLSTSSGTTGTPKLLPAPASAVVDPDVPAASFLPRDAVQLVSGPLCHAAPFTYAMRGLMTGHELVVLPRFDAGEALAAIERHRVTWAMLVPTTMQRIWRHPRRATTDVSSLEAVLHLGARCPETLKRDWIAWLGPDRVVEVYTGTEAPGLTMIDGHEWLEHPGSVGRPMPGSQCRVVDDSGRVLPAGRVGRLELSRDGRDGWHSLGDLGRMDADGFVWVVDRADDVIVTGAAKVHPADVEAVLDSHPAVRSSVVVGRQDADLGQRVHAVVEPDGPLDLDDLRSWVSDRLQPEQRPRSYELTDRTLRATTGKSRRRDWR